jgi:hypothetical protein
MRTSNIPAGSLRTSEVGLVWEEKISNALGTIMVRVASPFRVRAVADLTVTIDGVLAATMKANEILIFNAGDGKAGNLPNQYVEVVIATGAAYVQVAREFDNGRSA